MSQLIDDLRAIHGAGSMVGDLCNHAEWLEQQLSVLKERLAETEANFIALEQVHEKTYAWKLTEPLLPFHRYMTEKQYQAQSASVKKVYEPFKCAHCRGDAT